MCLPLGVVLVEGCDEGKPGGLNNIRGRRPNRNPAARQLHLELIPGGAKTALSAAQAKTLLATVRPRDAAGKARRRVAAELISDLERVYQRSNPTRPGRRRLQGHGRTTRHQGPTAPPTPIEDGCVVSLREQRPKLVVGQTVVRRRGHRLLVHARASSSSAHRRRCSSMELGGNSRTYGSVSSRDLAGDADVANNGTTGPAEPYSPRST